MKNQKCSMLSAQWIGVKLMHWFERRWKSYTSLGGLKRGLARFNNVNSPDGAIQ
jgi:hypothetical protein